MTDKKKCNVYHLNRMMLLRQMLGINEEFLSNLDNWESYDAYLKKKDEIFRQLAHLNVAWGEDVTASCTESQTGEASRIMKLILSLNDDIAAAIEQERLKTLKSIKNKTKEKKITGYTHTVSMEQGGGLLDYKK